MGSYDEISHFETFFRLDANPEVLTNSLLTNFQNF